MLCQHDTPSLRHRTSKTDRIRDPSVPISRRPWVHLHYLIVTPESLPFLITDDRGSRLTWNRHLNQSSTVVRHCRIQYPYSPHKLYPRMIFRYVSTFEDRWKEGWRKPQTLLTFWEYNLLTITDTIVTPGTLYMSNEKRAFFRKGWGSVRITPFLIPFRHVPKTTREPWKVVWSRWRQFYINI